MMRTVRAVIDQRGAVRLLESVSLPEPHAALVTILDEEAGGETTGRELSLMSEQSLAKDWSRDEEDRAWAHLQSAPSS